MLDLTWSAFAYLRLPLAVAGVAASIGAVGAWMWNGYKAYMALAVMMVVFIQACAPRPYRIRSLSEFSRISEGVQESASGKADR